MYLDDRDEFGLCPICHKADGYANAGKSHTFYCKEHKTCWDGGSNLLDSWRDQSLAEQRRIWDEIGLERFKDVVPYFLPRTVKVNVLYGGGMQFNLNIRHLSDEQLEILLAESPVDVNLAEAMRCELEERKERLRQDRLSRKQADDMKYLSDSAQAS
jgi:hypothetical protein